MRIASPLKHWLPSGQDEGSPKEVKKKAGGGGYPFLAETSGLGLQVSGALGHLSKAVLARGGPLLSMTQSLPFLPTD